MNQPVTTTHGSSQWIPNAYEIDPHYQWFLDESSELSPVHGSAKFSYLIITRQEEEYCMTKEDDKAEVIGIYHIAHRLKTHPSSFCLRQMIHIILSQRTMNKYSGQFAHQVVFEIHSAE